MNLVQRKFYLPQNTYTQLILTAKIQSKSITELLRELVEKGLEDLSRTPNFSSAKTLLQIANKAEKGNWKGPANLASQHDTFFSKVNGV